MTDDVRGYFVCLTEGQLTALIEVLDEYDRFNANRKVAAPVARPDTLTAMYLRHARGRLRAALGAVHVGAPGTVNHEQED